MLLDGTIEKTEVLGCAYYDNHIEKYLLEYMLSIQGDLPLSDEDKSAALRLMKLSPSALASALIPQPMLYKHRAEWGDTIGDRINRNDRDYFFRLLHRCLVRDFRQGEGFVEYFFKRRKLVELETIEEIRVKGHAGLVFSDTLRERTRLGQTTPELGGGYVLVLLLDDTPEPWENLDEPLS
jgi:hypothetical protein